MFNKRAQTLGDTRDHRLDVVLEMLQSIQDDITELKDRLGDIEQAMVKPEKANLELADMKAQVRQSSEFMQKLVMQLIEAPPMPKIIEGPAKEPSNTLKAYLERKAANGSDHKPKLP